MTTSIVVVGAGGFGREAIDVIRAINESTSEPTWNLLGVLDDSPSPANKERLDRLDAPLLGGMAVLETVDTQVSVAVGVGSPQARRAIVRKLDKMQFTSPSLVHPAAVIGSEFSYDGGVIVCAGVSVGTNVRLGRHVHLNPHAVIGHDAVVDDFVSVNPNATVSGECTIGSGTLLGAGSVVLQGRTVGTGAVVGGSACVVTDVEPGVTVTGVPAAAREQKIKR